MNEKEVWIEGWSATGGNSPALCLGKTIAESFEEACKKILAIDDYLQFVKTGTIYGRKLFDNEKDARKNFG